MSWKYKIAGLAASASLAMAGVVALSPPAGAITGCPSGTVFHCYAIGRMGEDWTGNFVPLNGISTTLDAHCLGIDQFTDFVNYETWLATNLNVDPVGDFWVEGGEKYGIGVTGTDEGFQRFWADNTPSAGYWEHYLGSSSLDAFIKVDIIWIGGTGNWNVWFGSALEGTSVNNGAWGGGSDTGVETTTPSVKFDGYTLAWQYLDPSWNWHNVSQAGDGETVVGPLNVDGAIVPDNPGDDAVEVGQGASACTNGTIGPATAHYATTPAGLRGLALRAGRVNGDDSLRSIQYVKTMRSRIPGFTGHRRAPNVPVDVVELRGHFSGADASVPHGYRRPTGNTMIIVVNTRTGQVTDAGIISRPADLAALGHPAAISVR